jgi:tetratricopeptide (TPR) repeat protein
MKSAGLLQKIGLGVFLSTLFLIPLFFLPLTAEFYEFNKNSLLILSSLVMLAILTVGFVVDRQVRVTRSPFGLPLLALLVSWLLATILRSPNRVDALLDPTQTGTIFALVLFFWGSINFLRNRDEINLASITLIISLGILGLVSAIWATGIMTKLSFLPGYLKTAMWTPTGNPITTIVALVAGLPFVVTLLAKERRLNLRSGILAAALAFQIAGSALIGYRLIQPENRPLFLSQQAGWAIALDSVKISPLLGTGPSTFISNFTRFRPVTYNLTPNWSLRFTNSSNYYLQLLSTIGFLGLAAYVFLVGRTYMVLAKTLKGAHDSESANARVIALAGAAAACLIFASQLFIPATVVTLFLVVVFLCITTAALKVAGSSLVNEANIDIVAATSSGHRSPLLPWVLVILAAVLIVPSTYLFVRAYSGEMLLQQALTYAAGNDGKKTYDTLLLAMRANPYRDNYRVVYSQTNLLLANSIASNQNLSESDRTTATQLIQQSIREAKNAVALNPQKVSNMENLATVYRNLLNLAQGADQWTVASYRQAIQLDPVNPNLRIALGGVFYSLKSYDDAISMFRQAADLKPDLANAHYNLAAAYREKKEYALALSEMQAVVQLVDKTSPDFTKASEELEELRKQVGSAAGPAPETDQPVTLTTPAPLPSPKVSPLPLDSSFAPEAPATPSSQP